jgi:drug/metabolite transporter (DMT)-like permease
MKRLLKDIPGTRLQADAALIVVAMIWGSAFVVQRAVAADVGVFLFNGLRFLLAAIVLIPFSWISRYRNSELNYSTLDWKMLFLLGALLAVAAAFQQAGLMYTTAANAGFITGLYVIFIPFLSVAIFHRSIDQIIWIAAFISIFGMYLLSTQGQLSVNKGDLYELIGALLWAFHVIFIGIAVKKMEVFRIAIWQYLICATISILAGLIFEPVSVAVLADSMWAIIYTALFSVAIGYTLQVAAQRQAPPTDTAIILSAEAVFAAFFGWVFLQETLTVIQIFGCMTILAGILLVQVNQIWANR